VKILGFLLGLLVRLWAATWRVEIVKPDALYALRKPIVFAFWHGRQMPLTRAPLRKRLSVMVSLSRDGSLQSGVMRALGFSVVRGSSSRGGMRALLKIVRALGMDEDACFAVDGPRGPARRSKPGAAHAALASGAALVPVGSAVSWGFRLRRAWDDFLVPLPFARVVILASDPLDPTRVLENPEELDRAIDSAMDSAVQRLATT
jgi:lysophospholipid acyltransferase (LPLAT)-like uncharacterized protein